MFIYGKNSVLERLKTHPSSIKNLYIQDSFDISSIDNVIQSAGITCRILSKHELNCIKRIDKLQGILAEVEPFRYTPFSELIKHHQKQKTLIFLDRIYDPQNLGAIIRTAACFGNYAIVIPKHKACEVTETAVHIASGGENYVPVSLVNNLSNALIEAKRNNYWITGAIVKGGEDITSTKFPFPLGIVLGSEGEGIRYGVEKHIDIKVYIPMKGTPLSFNVTIACAIFCYEVSKQKKKF